MALWCRHLQTVTVPRLDAPKRLTLVVPYYENPRFLAEVQAPMWRTYPAALADRLTIHLVDDGSPVPAVKPTGLPHLRLFRIVADVRWNWLAARNIGAHEAADGWILFTDIDHVLPGHTLHAVMYGDHDPSTIYAFQRQEHTGQAAAPHSASFLMTRALFWQIGGYDETLSGHYGTDGDFRRRAASYAPMALLPEPLIRHEHLGDSSTTRYKRKQPEDGGVRRLVNARRLPWRPRVLSFPYAEVTA